MSADALLGSTAGVGSTITVSLNGAETARTIVAIYDRSLAFRDYLIETPGGAVGTVLVRTTEPSSLDDAIAAAALVPPVVFAANAPGSSDQAVSSVLLFALLVFGLLAAINTLVTLIRSRRPESALLTRTGAPRTLLQRVILAETILATVLALVLGVVAAIPAAAGAGVSLLSSWPALPWLLLCGVPVAVMACAVTAATVAAGTSLRGPWQRLSPSHKRVGTDGCQAA